MHATIHAPVETSGTMKLSRDSSQDEQHGLTGPGFGGLLRSLFSRLPWGEMCSGEEILVVPAPAGRAVAERRAPL